MSSGATVFVLVEGATERLFVKGLLAPYLHPKKIWLIPVVLDKPGEKGGDVKFARAKKDIGRHLKQRADTWVTLMVDYYGIGSDWPGRGESESQAGPDGKASVMKQATAQEVARLFPDRDPTRRFIPYVSMYEMEALYFSDPSSLAKTLGVAQASVDVILEEYGSPERINDRPETVPSKRLKSLMSRFKKTTTGLKIAEAVGINAMRRACPLFDEWVRVMEDLAEGT